MVAPTVLGALAAGSSLDHLRLLAPPVCEAPLLAALHALDNGTAILGLGSACHHLVYALPSFRKLASQAERLARALPRCRLKKDVQSGSGRAPTVIVVDSDIGTSATHIAAESTAMQAAVSAVARSKAKVANAIGAATATQLRTRFLILIILFIKHVVIPEFLCPPVVDGLMSFMGPEIAYYIVAPLVEVHSVCGKSLSMTLSGLICSAHGRA